MKINIDNEEKLALAIKTAEGKATVRTVTPVDIQHVCHVVQEGIAKKKFHGTKIHYSGAQKFPNAYKHKPMSTHWTAENINGNWYVTDIHRDTCPNRLKNVVVEYSEIAKAAIIEDASSLEIW